MTNMRKYSSNHSSENKRRKTVGLTIRPDLLVKAREMNLNLSKLLENTLERIIEPQNNCFSLSEGSLFSKRESSMEPRAGFDPATNSLRGCRSTGLSHRGIYCELSETHILKTFGNIQLPLN